MDNLQYIDIPMGQGSGFNSLQSLGNFPITDLQLADTITFQNGTVAKEPGIAKVNNTVISDAPTIIGLCDFWPSPNVQVPILATNDGRIVSYGLTGVIDTLASGLAGTGLVTFCTALGGSSTRKLFCFTGSDTPQVTSDGVSMAAMSKPAADWTGSYQPIAGVMHNNRLWCFGNGNFPHMIYFSTLADQEDFQTLVVESASNVVGTQASVVVGSDANNYTCIVDHTSSAQNEPGVGSVWQTYWTLGGSGEIEWTSDVAYFRGNSYICILDHVASESNRPVTGVDWATYWSESGVSSGTVWESETSYVKGNADVAGLFSIYPGEGQRIIGACDFANILYIFKYPAGIYWIDDSSTSMSNWVVHKLNTNVGMAGPLAGAQVDNDFVFLTPVGTLSSLVAVQQYGLAASVQTASILPANLMTYMQQNLQINYIYNAVAAYNAYKRELHVAFAQSGFTYNNRRLVLDLRDSTHPMLSISSRDICNALTTMIDSNGVQKLIIGDNVGFVRMLDQSGYTKDGGAYVGKFHTANATLIEGGKRRANLASVEITFQPTGPYILYLDVYLDGVFKYTILFSMAGNIAGGLLDSFILGTSVLAGGGGVLNSTKRLMGDCRRISFMGYNSESGGNFSISNIRIYFTVGSARL